MALHILDDDNGVVNDQACRKRDAKECQRIDGEAEELDEGEGADERNRDRNRRDDGRAPVQQKEEDDNNDDNNSFAKSHQHFMDRVADDRSGIKGDGVLQAWRKALRKLLQHGLGVAIDIESIRIRELLHTNADRRKALEL